MLYLYILQGLKTQNIFNKISHIYILPKDDPIKTKRDEKSDLSLIHNANKINWFEPEVPTWLSHNRWRVHPMNGAQFGSQIDWGDVLRRARRRAYTPY